MAWNKLSTYCTTIARPNGDDLTVTYHRTAIVMTYAEAGRRVVQLDTGGWDTVTTKRKMNQAAQQFGLGYGIHQKNHKWFVTTKAGTFPFDDSVFVFDAVTGIPWGVFALFTGDERIPVHA